MPLTRNAARPRRARLFTAALLLFVQTNTPAAASAQGGGQRRRAAAAQGGTRAPAARRDPEVARMLGEIDARSVERTIRKLVSFGTRNTLSRQDDPARGIGAARDWIYAEMQRYSRESGGRLKVELQGFDQEPGKFPRIAKRTRLTNVVATLPGAQGESASRVYVVSGHYDSMCSSPTDAECDAPGANDDASGTAAVLEMARVMEIGRAHV